MNTAAHPTLSRQQMEARRLEAAGALLNGLAQSTVARRFGVSRTTASRWSRALRRSGVEALRRRRPTGRPCRLTAEQLASIPGLLVQGARAYGFATDRWTTGRLAHLIELRFGVRYDPDHVGRLMHRLGLRKRPEERPAPAALLAAYAASRYSPNTLRNASEISPTVA